MPNVKSRYLNKLSAGDNVRMQPTQSGQNDWREATVDEAPLNRSYVVKHVTVVLIGETIDNYEQIHNRCIINLIQHCNI